MVRITNVNILIYILRCSFVLLDDIPFADGVSSVANGTDTTVPQERDTPRVAPLPPLRVDLPTSSPVVQIACGMHHTVVLTLSGECFTFGSNQYGQLGTGNLQAQLEPYAVKVAGAISQIAAGSNHTVLLTSHGAVFTFGNHAKGQLGRVADGRLADEGIRSGQGISGSPMLADSWNAALNRQQFLWNCSPGIVK